MTYNPAVMRIMREVQFALVSLGGSSVGGALWPELAIRVFVGGPIDPRTGFVANASSIDEVVRESAVPLLQRWWAEKGAAAFQPAELMGELYTAVAERLGGLALERLELHPGPHRHWAIHAGGSSMVVFTQIFEFAAGHRLHMPGFSDEENHRNFGKCANPGGHGHNYVVEVSVSGTPDPARGPLVDLPVFERTVRERVIDRFDHKHLNTDCPEFAERNPTVENLAQVIWGLLAGAFNGCVLSCIRVWETPRTHAEYRGE